MKRNFSLMLMLLAAFGLIFTSCKDDEDDDPVTEFIADDGSFENYDAWNYITENMGPDAALGPAHAGNDSTAVRKIWQNNDNTRSDGGKYPVGTIFFKEVKNEGGDVIGLTAMAKRGNDFDPDHNDWEWFMLDPATGNIAERGLFDGMCFSCHMAAEDTDYVFSKN